MSHEEFADRYRFLSTVRPIETTDAKEICRLIVSSYTQMDGEIRVGNSQIYATEHGIELAEQWKLRIRNQAASIVQRWWREHLRKKRAAIVLQRWMRMIIKTRAANKIKHWWSRKRSTAKTLSKIGQIFRSVRVIQRNVRRWLSIKAFRRNLKELKRKSCVLITEPVASETFVPAVNSDAIPQVTFQVSPNWIDNNNCAKSTRPSLSLISLQLSRTSFFYSEGIISIRRPPTVS